MTCKTASHNSEYFFLFKVVDDSYDGPHLEDGKVTFEFVKQLLTRFKDQKKIHKKYAYTVRVLATLRRSVSLQIS